ncbi:hypothetical protein CJF30_00011102 [Rutstroemia sp. NJR-2017a BBW]|nr:hypothetical protein CJF30_00011102 [Rutstroemia sp. NJR-2017a BBW]
MPQNKMTKSDSSRIQSSQTNLFVLQQAKNNRDMSSSGFAARAQSAGDRANYAGGAGGSRSTGSTGSGNTGGGKAASTGNNDGGNGACSSM